MKTNVCKCRPVNGQRPKSRMYMEALRKWYFLSFSCKPLSSVGCGEMRYIVFRISYHVRHPMCITNRPREYKPPVSTLLHFECIFPFPSNGMDRTHTRWYHMPPRLRCGALEHWNQWRMHHCCIHKTKSVVTFRLFLLVSVQIRLSYRLLLFFFFIFLLLCGLFHSI